MGVFEMDMAGGQMAVVPEPVNSKSVDVYIHFHVPPLAGCNFSQNESLENLVDRGVDPEQAEVFVVRDEHSGHLIFCQKEEMVDCDGFVSYNSGIGSNFLSTVANIRIDCDMEETFRDKIWSFSHTMFTVAFQHVWAMIQHYLGRLGLDVKVSQGLQSMTDEQIQQRGFAISEMQKLVEKKISAITSGYRQQRPVEYQQAMLQFLILDNAFYKIASLISEKCADDYTESEKRLFYGALCETFATSVVCAPQYSWLEKDRESSLALLPMFTESTHRVEPMADFVETLSAKLAQELDCDPKSFPDLLIPSHCVVTGRTRQTMHFVCYAKPPDYRSDTYAALLPLRVFRGNFMSAGVPAMVSSRPPRKCLLNMKNFGLTLRIGNSVIESAIIALADALQKQVVCMQTGQPYQTERRVIGELCEFLGVFRDLTDELHRTYLGMRLSYSSIENVNLRMITFVCNKHIFPVDMNEVTRNTKNHVSHLPRCAMQFESSGLTDTQHPRFGILDCDWREFLPRTMYNDLPTLKVHNHVPTMREPTYLNASQLLDGLSTNKRPLVKRFFESTDPVRVFVQYTIHRDRVSTITQDYPLSLEAAKTLRRPPFCYSYMSTTEEEKNCCYHNQARMKKTPYLGCQFAGQEPMIRQLVPYKAELIKVTNL